jgi:hemerythrin-like domain-containing protein
MDIYEALKKDHSEIKQVLDELLALQKDDEYRFVLIEEVRNLLVPHARAEEEVFYNTLRAVNADKSVVRHGFKEHMEAEALLRTLQVMDRMNFDWKSTAEKLKDALEHHINDEETEIFDEAQQAFTQEEATMLGEAFEELKPQIEQQSTAKNTLDMVINMMPPRLAENIRHFTEGGPSNS